MSWADWSPPPHWAAGLRRAAAQVWPSSLSVAAFVSLCHCRCPFFCPTVSLSARPLTSSSSDASTVSAILAGPQWQQQQRRRRPSILPLCLLHFSSLPLSLALRLSLSRHVSSRLSRLGRLSPLLFLAIVSAALWLPLLQHLNDSRWSCQSHG